MQTQSAPAQASANRDRDGVILVVDDEHDVLELVATALRRIGANVMTALSGDIALVILESGVRIDLLFTDVVMPGGLDGVVLGERAKQLHPAIKILYGTGFAALLAGETKARLHGDIVSKPYRLADLTRRVEALLGRGHTAPRIGCA
jgi:CheY-like chemotaxis protein